MLVKRGYMEKYLQFFYDIAAIPHGSKNSKGISDYLVCFANERGLEVIKDKHNNVIIYKNAYEGFEDREPIILQGHMDMVAVKTPECTKDMLTEGLDIVIEDNVLSAVGTSLGADDGIAVAYMLSILDSDVKAPALICIFTSDEEIGLLGAALMDASMLPAKRMINLDQEEEGIFVVSCAGGIRVNADIPVNKEIYNGNVYTLSVTGLKGGHSGMDIDKNRGNAITIIGQELCKLHERIGFKMVEINGGIADNAIPSSVTARIMLEGAFDNPLFEKEILKLNGMDMYFGDNANYDSCVITVKKENVDSMIALDDESTGRVLKFLNELPYGIMAMSEADSNMVETSLNPGIIESKEESIHVAVGIRSSIDIEKKNQVMKLCKLISAYKGSYELTGDYPGWAYNENSDLLKSMVNIYCDMYGNEPKVLGIHAGLECGLFSQKIPGLDCISIGPDIMDVHSVNERLPLDSANRCYEYLIKCLELV